MKAQNEVKEIKLNYNNNVNSLNALAKQVNSSLGYQLTRILEVHKLYAKDSIITFNKEVTKKDKETGIKTTEIVEVNFKFCPIQLSIVKRMKKDSDLFKFFESKVRRTKKGGFNFYYTLQSINKFQTELQEFKAVVTPKKVVQ